MKSLRVLAELVWKPSRLILPLCLVSAGGLDAAESLEPIKPGLLKPVALFDSDSLKVSGRGSWRWLSIPESRLVLNPFTKVVDGAAPTTDGLSLHAGYYVGTRAERLDGMLAIDLDPKTPVEQAWWPYKLELAIMEKSSGMKIKTTDFLADENTVLRVMDFQGGDKNSNSAIPKIGGQVKGNASFIKGGVLVADNGDWFSATCLATVGSIDECPAALTPISIDRKPRWSVQGLDLQSGRAVVVAAIGFASKLAGSEMAVQRARNALLGKPASELLSERKQHWDRLLAKVPHPVQFGLPGLGQATADVHRQWYYGAWTFMLSQLLAPMPENHYPHFSIAEGKPSLWAEGDSAAPAQCSWTCFMVTGMLAKIMPEKAWSVYEGIMSRVNDEGILLGECLPSRKAQGGWLLYSATGDRERLCRVYPAIKRYLTWREQNPRWIWGSGAAKHDIADEKDSSFVVSHLIDVDYAIRIASVLGLEKDVAFWREMTARELANYRRWFFPENDDPKNFYFTKSGTHVFKDRTEQMPCYILSGLAFGGMPEDLVGRLQKYYLKLRKLDQPLLGFNFMKYGESSFIAYGLADRGMHPEAEQFIERYLLDTMRPGGDFGETMEVSSGTAKVGGVCPSLFVALQAIDFTLMKNGMRIDQTTQKQDSHFVDSVFR